MQRLNSVQELQAIRDRLVAEQDPDRPTIVIPAGTCGQASGANDLIRIAKRELLARGLADTIRLRVTGCHGFCQREPSVLIEPDGTFYPNLDVGGMTRVIEALARGEVVEELLTLDPATGARIRRQRDIPFFRRQVRTILERNEKADPIRILQCLANGGYGTFARTLAEGRPEQVLEDVQASGLRGRGGAGFPTGLKWRLLRDQPDGRGKFLVCNADEGDPGAYMDRSVLEGNPHAILEGMLIGAFATGATAGVIYVRTEYPLAIKHLTIALRQARQLGLLGTDILGSGFSFDVDLVRGAGAFVCGEERALVRSIEGKMGEPRQRPPYPVARGIEGKPTAINNVETWANVPVVLSRVPPSSRGSGPRATPARRSSAWWARSATRGWSRSRWGPRCGKSSTRSAEARPARGRSRRCRRADRPVAAFPPSGSTCRWTTRASRRPDRSWARAG